MSLETRITTTRNETYQFKLENNQFEVVYTINFLDSPIDIGPNSFETLDQHVSLYQILTNHYHTPLESADNLELAPHIMTRGKDQRRELIRTVSRDLGQNLYCTEISQYRDISQDLYEKLEQLPEHVHELLEREYSDPDVQPYHFNQPKK